MLKRRYLTRTPLSDVLRSQRMKIPERLKIKSLQPYAFRALKTMKILKHVKTDSQALKVLKRTAKYFEKNFFDSLSRNQSIFSLVPSESFKPSDMNFQTIQMPKQSLSHKRWSLETIVHSYLSFEITVPEIIIC